eukprot:3722397-Amphidinium_carterae.1
MHQFLVQELNHEPRSVQGDVLMKLEESYAQQVDYDYGISKISYFRSCLEWNMYVFSIYSDSALYSSESCPFALGHRSTRFLLHRLFRLLVAMMKHWFQH